MTETGVFAYAKLSNAVLKDASRGTQAEDELHAVCNVTLPKYATVIEFRFLDRLAGN